MGDRLFQLLPENARWRFYRPFRLLTCDRSRSWRRLALWSLERCAGRWIARDR